MKLYIAVFFIVSSLNNVIAQNSQNAEPLTLNRLWETIDKNNKNLKVNDLDLQRSELNIGIEKDKRLPSLLIQGNYAVNTKAPLYNNGLFSGHDYLPASQFAYSFGYLLDFNLYNGGKDKRAIQIRKEENIIQKNEYDLQRNNIRYASAAAYYDLYKFLNFLQFVESEISTEKMQLKTIESLFKNGTVLKSDVLRSSLKISKLELTRSDIEKRIAIAKQRLNVLMGKNADDPVSIEQNEHIDIASYDEKAGYASYLNKVFNNSPEFKIVQTQFNISTIELKQAKSNILPNVSLYSYYNYNYPQSTFYPYSENIWGFGQTGIKFSVPLSGLYTNRKTVQSSSVLREQQEKKIEIKKDEIALDIKEAYLQKLQAFEEVKTAEENIRQSSETVRILRNSYMNQESLLNDLLEAENLLLEAKFSLTTANINVVLSHFKLLVKTGII